jgi:multidrug efflux system membrane fusion protein
MTDLHETVHTEAIRRRRPGIRARARARAGARAGAVAVALLAGGVVLTRPGHGGAVTMPAAPPPAHVTVSRPLTRDIASRTGFLGQFSAVDMVELRAQVGGILTEIHFTDGQIVHKGDLLFVIDPRPYEIRLAQAVAQVRSAQAHLTLANSELWRAQQLKRTDFGTGQSVDQRQADLLADQAALDLATAAVRDAQLDVEFCSVRAPFTGRISEHRVAIGSLVSGSRAGSSATTLLTTLVSLDPIHLDFDMSETDFLAYQAGLGANPNPSPTPVAIKLANQSGYDIKGTLDFIDNALDRSSGTIHARATVPNPDLRLVPGEFARLRLNDTAAHPVLLVPAAAVVPDQSQHMLMTVSADGHVVPKIVSLGGLRGGLQIITGGLLPTDRVIIDGLMHAMPGAPVVAEPGKIDFDPSADTQD